MLLKSVVSVVLLWVNFASADVKAFPLGEIYQMSEFVFLGQASKIHTSGKIQQVHFSIITKYKGPDQKSVVSTFMLTGSKEQIRLHEKEFGIAFLKKQPKGMELFKFIRLDIRQQDLVDQQVTCSKVGVCNSNDFSKLLEQLSTRP